jgi:hypothetical protein
MLSTRLECFLQGWNAFDSVGIPLYRARMLCTGLEFILHSWNTFVQCWNAFYRFGIPLYRVGMPSTGMEYLCTRLECFLEG